LASTAWASLRTAAEGVPEGGATLIWRYYCDPVSRNCVGMWGTSNPAHTTSSMEMPITPQRLRLL
jgi:hypothetical protein